MRLKTEKEIDAMAEGGRLLARIMEEIKLNAKAGIGLLALDKLAHELTKESGAEPAFLGYRPEGALKPYPATICASINGIVVHGIPSEYKLKAGDVVKFDFGLRHKGLCVDAAITIGIQPTSTIAQNLIKTTKLALEAAINQAVVGNTIGDIGFAIQTAVEKNKFKVIKGLTGHGVGEQLHEDPVVYNFGKPGKGEKLVAGMTLAIEPITAVGTEHIVQLDDDSYATADGGISAHFEHTVAITDAGPRILTLL